MTQPREANATGARTFAASGAGGLDPAWRTRLGARVRQPPSQPRVPLRAPLPGPLPVGPQGVVIGSIEPELAARMQRDALPLRPAAEGGWQIEAHRHGSLDAALQALAEWLRAQRLASRWRHERLDVRAPAGAPVGCIERSAMRALGLATHAVHLVGRDPSGAWWVQQRALDKAVDPGLWDTLMGGLVSAGESIESTLQRETDEEAGLAIASLHGLVHADALEVRRPVADGYMIEAMDVFEAVVPAGIVPANRDGEVERFERLTSDALRERLHADRFTLEAAWVLARALERAG